jgi:hypothetical protein
MYGRLVATLRQNFPTDEGSSPHNAWDFIHEFGSVDDVLLYAQLFCPEFTEVDGSILLKRVGDNVEKRFLDAKASGRMPLQELEASFNILEVPYIFSCRQSSDEEIALLAKFLVEAWRARLRYLYEPRKFNVSVVNPDENIGIVTVENPISVGHLVCANVQVSKGRRFAPATPVGAHRAGAPPLLRQQRLELGRGLWRAEQQA